MESTIGTFTRKRSGGKALCSSPYYYGGLIEGSLLTLSSNISKRLNSTPRRGDNCQKMFKVD